VEADMTVSRRIQSLGLVLPGELRRPGGSRYPFEWVRVRGDRAFVSGHLPLNSDGTLLSPLGKVGSDLSLEQGFLAARSVALAMLGSLERQLGELERIEAWLRVFGMVNAAPGFTQIPPVVNGFSDLILELFGPDRGAHSRSAVGVAELPFGVPVEVEAEIQIAP
jgi:enamine deaminase RidA (YjgF/YER057c/UK114 family)